MDEETFETTDILKAMDVVDSIGARCQFDQDGIRNDFLRLHSMAHERFNGGTAVCSLKPGETIEDLGEELLDDISDWIVALRQVQKTLDKLVALAPDEELASMD